MPRPTSQGQGTRRRATPTTISAVPAAIGASTRRMASRARTAPIYSRAMPGHDGRFAPSPTGVLHVGNLRTALLAWLFARSAGARFLMRVEDLDAGRVRPGYE